MNQPPRFEFPPAILSSSISGDDYPFSENLEKSAIPPGMKALLSPPSTTLLHLDFEHDTTYTNTRSFEGITEEIISAHPTFIREDAATNLSPQELNLNFSVHSMRPSGYLTTPTSPPPPQHFSAHYHVPFESVQNAATNFQVCFYFAHISIPSTRQPLTPENPSK